MSSVSLLIENRHKELSGLRPSCGISGVTWSSLTLPVTRHFQAPFPAGPFHLYQTQMCLQIIVTRWAELSPEVISKTLNPYFTETTIKFFF